MNDRQAGFVEEMGMYLSSVGMTPIAGRLLAWLLICDPEQQTAADLAHDLHASRGAISGAIRQLESAGFVRRTRRGRRPARVREHAGRRDPLPRRQRRVRSTRGSP